MDTWPAARFCRLPCAVYPPHHMLSFGCVCTGLKHAWYECLVLLDSVRDTALQERAVVYTAEHNCHLVSCQDTSSITILHPDTHITFRSNIAAVCMLKIDIHRFRGFLFSIQIHLEPNAALLFSWCPGNPVWALLAPGSSVITHECGKLANSQRLRAVSSTDQVMTYAQVEPLLSSCILTQATAWKVCRPTQLCCQRNLQGLLTATP